MNKLIENYILSVSDEEDEVLKELSNETHRKVLMPRMLSGHIQGKMLEMMSKMIRPEYILELGTYTGYSAICLAKGLKNNGKLITIEINDELEKIIRKYISKSGNEGKIELRTGNALEIIPQLPFTFDLVFIDADKRYYSEYYDAVFDKVSSGGFILADNVLWNGKVLSKIEPNDAYTLGIHKFNEKIKADPRVEKVLVPNRDGIFIIRKK